MAVQSFRCQRAAILLFVAYLISFPGALAFTSSEYQLDSEYSGANFFEGWDFFTGGDPTGGFVTYYSQGSAQLKGMINASDTSPVYIGSDYTTSIGSTQGAGRPSVRISTQRSWTHGLFIGDFNHAPGGVCGTWPAFWTLGPNWPYNGEIDIMEGVNLLEYNAATLHAAPNCTIAGDPRFMTGQLSSTNNCAYYPGYNVGCGVTDTRNTSYGAGFNAIGGGIYAMQWTSEYIRVWIFARGSIPNDIINGTPNPSSWGLPSANLQGDCIIDQKFQDHSIVLNNAFCGEYAGAPGVWDSATESCATITGYSTCNGYVAAVPGAFQDAYWSINSIRVYQLVDPNNSSSTGTPYIASDQPTQSTVSTTASTPVPTISLCPTYNFTVVQSGIYNYEVECGYDIGGFDLGPPYSSYSYTNFEGCVGGCTYWNTYNGSNSCAGVTYNVEINACYWKSLVYSNPSRTGFNSARLLYYAYPQVTDDPRSQTTTTSTGVYVATSVTPNYYVASNVTTTTSLSLITQTPTGNVTNGPGMGGGVTSTTGSSSTGNVTSSPNLSSITTSEPFSYLSTTATTTMLSSTSSLTTTQATTAASTSPASSQLAPMATTSTIQTIAQLSSQDLSLSTSASTTIAVPSTSSGPSNPSSNPVSASASASAPTTPSPSTIVSSTPEVSSSPRVVTSSPVSQAQSPTTASTGTTSGVIAPNSQSSSISPAPGGTSSSRPAEVSSSPASSMIVSLSSSPFSLMSPPPPSSSIIAAEPATSSPTTVVTSEAAPPPSSSLPSSLYTSPSLSSSLPFSQSASPSEQPASTSNPPPVFSTTPVPPAGSSGGNNGGGGGASSSSFATPLPSFTTTMEPTTEVLSSTTTSEALPGPTEVVSPNGATFSFAGCLGPRPNTPFANSFVLVEDSPAMSIDRCVLDCSMDVYAGLYYSQCYCSSYSLPTDVSEDFIEYPASACNTTCPGDPTQKCGGTVSSSSPPSRFVRRQITNADGDTILLTLYNNTAADAEINSSSTSVVSMTTSSGAMTGGPGVGSTTAMGPTGLSMSAGGSTSFSTPAPPLVTSSTPAPAVSTSTSGSQTDDTNLSNPSTTSIITATSLSSALSVGFSDILTSLPSSSSSSSSSTSSLSLSPIIISTTYTKICDLDPIVCPTRTETCLATTITVLHCGCTDTPVPEVPMTTTVVEACPTTPAPNAQQAQQGGATEEDNAVPLTTLTIPCQSEISSLEASVTAWSASASASAQAAAHVSAEAQAAATAHPNVPYTIPVSFPMTSSATAVTQTLNLVVATAPFNFSVPGVPSPSNGSWGGEVKNMTIVPVALTAMVGESAGASAVAGASVKAGFRSEGSLVRGWGGERGAWVVGFVGLSCVVGLEL